MSAISPDPSGMSLPAAMQHLAVLESAGLVMSEKAGRVRTCRIEAAAFGVAEAWIASRRADWEHRLDRLAVYLDDSQEGDDHDARA